MYNNSTRHILFIFIFGNCQLSTEEKKWFRETDLNWFKMFKSSRGSRVQGVQEPWLLTVGFEKKLLTICESDKISKDAL